MVLCVGDVGADELRARPDATEHGVDDFGDRVYRLALRITGVSGEAEAAVDVALRMAASATQRLASESAFESWLLVRVACAAHQMLRRRRPHGEGVALDDVLPPVDDDDGHFQFIDDWSTRIDDQALQGRLGDAVGAAIDTLPADYRTALILNDAEGVTPSDIGEILDVDASTARRYVHRARLFVRKRLSEHFGTH